MATRDISKASTAIVSEGSGGTSRHIEDDYIIGNELGSGVCGKVYFCKHRVSNEHYAVKIIDTRKYLPTPGLSINELKEEAGKQRRAAIERQTTLLPDTAHTQLPNTTLLPDLIHTVPLI